MYTNSKERYESVPIDAKKIEWTDRVKFLAASFEDAVKGDYAVAGLTGEAGRLQSLAITHLETATMFAVKSISRA